MSDKTIKILVVEPMKPCRVQEVADELDALQAIVGGNIESVSVFNDSVTLICNENGIDLGLPANRPLVDQNGLPYDFILGTFFITGVEGENFVSLTDEQIKTYKGLYDNMMVLGAERKPEAQVRGLSAAKENKTRSGDMERPSPAGELRFDGVEHYDEFPDGVIFWLDVSGLPCEIQDQARMIDGTQYNASCFGMCVCYDLEKKCFDIVTDTDLETGGSRNIFYIDVSGDKHWFKTEIPEKFSDQIFSECGKVMADHIKPQPSIETKTHKKGNHTHER